MPRKHVIHPTPGQVWGAGKEPKAVRDAYDRQRPQQPPPPSPGPDDDQQ